MPVRCLLFHVDPAPPLQRLGGFQVWLAGRAAPRLLRTWWHLDGGSFNTEHDYEQVRVRGRVRAP